jgi:hypothetical protein
VGVQEYIIATAGNFATNATLILPLFDACIDEYSHMPQFIAARQKASTPLSAKENGIRPDTPYHQLFLEFKSCSFKAPL